MARRKKRGFGPPALPAQQALPPGLIAIPCGDSARYTDFAASIASLIAPEGSGMLWCVGSVVADNSNDAARGLLSNPEADWLLVMGDDHTFGETWLLAMLRTMYDNDLDVLAPFVYRRTWPPVPVVYDHVREGAEDEIDVYLPMKASTIEGHLLKASQEHTRPIVPVLAAGTGGMVIRRRVFEGMEYPYFRNGIGNISQAGEDVNFCIAVRRAGFRVHVALDITLGHLTTARFTPEVHDGQVGVRVALGGSPGLWVPLTEGGHTPEIHEREGAG